MFHNSGKNFRNGWFLNNGSKHLAMTQISLQPKHLPTPICFPCIFYGALENIHMPTMVDQMGAVRDFVDCAHDFKLLTGPRSLTFFMLNSAEH